MNDTHPIIREKMKEIFLHLGDEERLAICSRLYQFGRQIMESVIKEQNPNLDELEIQLAVFRRMYYKEIPPDEMDWIVSKLRESNKIQG